MNKVILSFVLLTLAVFFAYGYYLKYVTQKGYDNNNFIERTSNMILTSPVFSNGNSIPTKYTCDGTNVNPPLNISGVSMFTRGLVLIVEDPDSPSKDFTHWIIFDIDPLTNGIEENSIPQDAVEGLNDFGQPHYGGPCPPSGIHRYIFKLYALDTKLGLEKGAKKQDVLNAMKGHILEQAKLIGKYQLSG